MEELLVILKQLEENTEIILMKNKELEEEINILKGYTGDIIEEIPKEMDCGLLGKLEDITYTIENGVKYIIDNNTLILEGNNRYANISISYKEKEEDCIQNVKGRYNVHIEGYKVIGCDNAYINTMSNQLVGDTFVFDKVLDASWQRKLKFSIFLNNTNSQNSKMVITSLKVTKAV